MLKILTSPKESGFQLLKMLGSLSTVAAVLVMLFMVFSVMVSLITSGGSGLKPSMAVFGVALIYVPPLLLIGQLLHWLVAMWEAKVETNSLLYDLRNEMQYNKSLKDAPTAQDASDAGTS